MFSSGSTEFFSFLVPMERVFEQFIAGVIKAHLPEKLQINVNKLFVRKLWHLATFRGKVNLG
jgi:5-methylcytosine-specific restriction endonuclease McrBC regulatory subunit McrC